MSRASVNKVVLMGNLGKDPELKHTPGGIAVTQFSMATTDHWKDQETGKKKEYVEWHLVEAWRSLAERCAKYLKRGAHVYVEGKLVTTTDEKNGVKRHWTKIRATEVQFLDKP